MESDHCFACVVCKILYCFLLHICIRDRVFLLTVKAILAKVTTINMSALM